MKKVAIIVCVAIAVFQSCYAEQNIIPKPETGTTFVSMQEILRVRDNFVDRKVMVIGYLSSNCTGLCLFSYRDDAMNFNSINSINILLDGLALSKVRSACSEHYVTVKGEIGTISGFTYPGFTKIEHIRILNAEKTSSGFCWENK